MHFVFKYQKHNYFCCDFLDLLVLNLSFVTRILKWNSEVDYIIF